MSLGTAALLVCASLGLMWPHGCVSGIALALWGIVGVSGIALTLWGIVRRFVWGDWSADLSRYRARLCGVIGWLGTLREGVSLGLRLVELGIGLVELGTGLPQGLRTPALHLLLSLYPAAAAPLAAYRLSTCTRGRCQGNLQVWAGPRTLYTDDAQRNLHSCCEASSPELSSGSGSFDEDCDVLWG